MYAEFMFALVRNKRRFWCAKLSFLCRAILYSITQKVFTRAITRLSYCIESKTEKTNFPGGYNARLGGFCIEKNHDVIPWWHIETNSDFAPVRRAGKKYPTQSALITLNSIMLNPNRRFLGVVLPVIAKKKT